MKVFILLVLFTVSTWAYHERNSVDPYYYIRSKIGMKPPFPTYSEPPETSFDCVGKLHRFYADVEAECQAYHLCRHQMLITSRLCANGTLFNEQTQSCEHYFKVRCNTYSRNGL